MANLKDIKRQIKSVKNTQKTTRAMKLVSTAKLRRTEEFAKKSKLYAKKINEVLSDIAMQIEHFKIGGIDSKFFAKNEKIEKVDIIFITADKGLCGGFNHQTIKTVKNLMSSFKDRKIKVRLRAIGRKGIDYFRFNEIELLDSVINLSSQPSYERAAEFMKRAVEDYLNGITDQIILIHNGYLNMITQQIKVVDLLPIKIDTVDIIEKTSLMEVEPKGDEELVLEQLVQKYLDYNVYYSLIDSLAAEHSARMQAMDNATRNAKEMVSQLTLDYNKARQASITTELIEIISGMESMK
ncbi:MAG: F0F1 ATP synthase subunit gamma [Campylobacterales bacterium]|nr:F0F1 ATP synthase subunit gamma [Campylobacterales bacterium]